MSSLKMPRPVRLVLLVLISLWLSLFTGLAFMVAGSNPAAVAGAKCFTIDFSISQASAGGLLKEKPVIISDRELDGAYVVMIFVDGSAALLKYGKDGCMSASLVGTEAQGRSVIAAAAKRQKSSI